MIEERAIVVATSDDMLEIEVQQASSCGSCDAKSGCGTHLLSALFPKRARRLTVENRIGATVGDQVIVAIEEKLVVRSSLQLYLLPLLGLIAGAILFDQLARLLLFHQELFQIIGGLLGMAVMFLVVHFQGRKTSSASIQVHRSTGLHDQRVELPDYRAR